MVGDWQAHLANIQYFVQFHDDVNQLKTISFHSVPSKLKRKEGEEVV
jgi:hypothetical protein